ncbi:hypothetical protein M8J75_013880 [Diaphorina citri]|nr:hypothetical protein M8J75_013880 [Diaphorina citri]
MTARLVNTGETMSTLGLSDAEVRLMVRMFGRSSIPFNVVDYYLSRQNKATAFTGGNQYFNVYENARLHGLHGGEKLTHETYPDIPLSTKPPFDWLVDFTDNDDGGVAEKVAELMKSNQSVVDYFLAHPVNTEGGLPKTRTFKWDNVYEKARVEIEGGTQMHSSDILETTTDSGEIIISDGEPITDIEIEASTNEVTSTPPTVKTTVTFTSTHVESKPHCTSTSHSNETSGSRFIHYMKNLFGKYNVFKKTTKPEKMGTTVTSTTKISRYHWKRLLYKLKKARKAVVRKFQNLRTRGNATKSKGFLKRIMEYFKRNKTENVTQAPMSRKRRQVNLREHNETTDKSFTKGSTKPMGFFKRMLNMFRRNKNVVPETHNEDRNVENKEVPTDDVEVAKSAIFQSKFTCETSKISISIQDPKFKENILSTKLNSVDAVSPTVQNSTIFFSRTSKPDTLSENDKKFIAKFCNTSEPLPSMKIEDFLAGISTKSGQKWWEAWHQNKDSSSSEEMETIPSDQKDLWNYFQKSLKNNVSEILPTFTTSCTLDSISSPFTVKTKHKSYQFEDVQLNVHTTFQCHDSRISRCTDTSKTESKLQDPLSRSTILNSIASTFTSGNTLRNSQRTLPTSTIFNLNGRTYYGTQIPVFTFKRKPKSTKRSQLTSTKEDDAHVITDDPRLNFNGTWDYQDFLAFMRASVSPELRSFFTMTIPTTQVTIKKSILDMLKNIFRGGRPAKKTESEEDYEHYKKLCKILKRKGNITQEEFDKRKIGNIQIKWV